MAIAALPDEAKLLRNFSRCQDWEQRYLYDGARRTLTTINR